MTTKQILAICNTLNFQQANEFIEKSGLQLELIQNLSFTKLWRVVNHKEVCYISNCYKSLVTGMSEVKFVFNG